MATSKARESVPRAPKTPNRVLRGIREDERHETRAEFAEAMARVAREIGENVCPDAKYVERLESGAITRPRQAYRNILVYLCARPASELGFISPMLSRPHSSDSAPVHSNMPLRDAILSSGMEVTELARKVGVNPKSVERWITQGRVPHLRHRWNVCRALGRDESELWPGTISNQELLETKPEVSGALFQSGSYGLHSGLSPSDIRPILSNMSGASAVSVLSALREVQRGYLMADCLIGSLSVAAAVRTQIPLVERACEVTRGADRTEALNFACVFMEFCGWIHQDAGDLSRAMFWTDRAFDYAIEISDQRTIAYTLMRKSAIATEAGNPAQGLGIANFALTNANALTPRLRAVILRQRAHAHAALRETEGVTRDADSALVEALAGIDQDEEDRAPYCSPVYVAMEAGQSMVTAGQAQNALTVLDRSRLEWSDHDQVRDYALCVSRLAAAYAAAGEPKQACEIAEEAISLAYGIGSRRVVGQLGKLSEMLGRWHSDPMIAATQGKLGALVGSFRQQ